MKRKIVIGFSPCPNDTFIFDAMVNSKLDTGDLLFDYVLDDVETLNQWALSGKLEVSKVSYGVLPQITDKYVLLNSGSALGKGVGPLLININSEPIDFSSSVIAIPGEHTTANRLFSHAFPNAKNKIFIRYDKIEDYVVAGKGPGVIIHENRFTYAEKGLYKVADLGEKWEADSGYAIPLGGIVCRKDIHKDVMANIEKLIRESVEYSFRHQHLLSSFVKENAQEMSEEVMRKHIGLYVNDFTLDLGSEGRAAVMYFMSGMALRAPLEIFT